jgi:hypothetical protein
LDGRRSDLSLRDLSAEESAHIRYFLAHAYRQLNRPAEALMVCNEALPDTVSVRWRSMMLECRAMSLYDLGRLDEIPGVVAEAERLDLPVTVKGHLLGLQGCLLSRQLDPAAFSTFQAAEDLFTDANHAYGASWVQRSAAALAIKLSGLDRADELLCRVTFPMVLPEVRLLQAQVLYLRGLKSESADLVNQVISGCWGEPAVIDRARAHYLQAVRLADNGLLVQASEQVYQAFEELRLQQRYEIDLTDALNALRFKIRNWGVA